MSNLYIIATPIGNLEDITLRALRILKEVDIVYCEDTRVSSKLFHHYEIELKKIISYNKDNEAKKIAEIINHLDRGSDLALLSDAGTPLISDPGALLVQALFVTEHKLIPIPGASSLITALSVVPFDCSRFIFEGFLPHGPKQRRRILRQLVTEPYPLVLFESPHRISKTLADIENIFGSDRKVFLARELTKKFEQLYYSTSAHLINILTEQFTDKPQGEFVLVIENFVQPDPS